MTKPFSPEDVQKILQVLDSPAVFLNMTDDWPALSWTLENLSVCLGEKSVCFRVGKRGEEKAPQFETECSYVEATLSEFLFWIRGGSGSAVGQFRTFPLTEFWAYADYKYISVLFHNNTNMFKDVVWSDFGYPGRDGEASTLWMGTSGANTPCHLDSYGCNLVLQIQGRKRWYLFPPEDTGCMYPTRIPYEESSVFSQVSVTDPDLSRHPAFQRARAHLVTLQPGQVLFVPRHWWHYVESVDPVTVSVNSWIEMEEDDEARVGEALTKTIICALKTTNSLDNKDNWLNPTEDKISSHDENMQYLNLALKACVDKKRNNIQSESSGKFSLKRDFTGHLKTDAGPVHFSSHLIPVTCDQQESPKQNTSNHKETDAPFSPENSTTLKATDTHETGETSDQQEEEEKKGGQDGEKCGHVSTNDLLDCLLHPDVITLLTRLMMDRQKELDSK